MAAASDVNGSMQQPVAGDMLSCIRYYFESVKVCSVV